MPKFKLGNKLNKILKIEKEKFIIHVEFNDGTKGKFNCEFLFIKPQGLATEILIGNFFDKCFIENGALAWPNGFELCPDSIKMKMIEQKSITTKKKVA